ASAPPALRPVSLPYALPISPLLVVRERLEVPPDRLHEHQFRKTREHVLSARPLAARFLGRDMQERFQPPSPLLHIAATESGGERSEEHTPELQAQANLVCLL